jgi:hypothetical protein
VSKTELLRKGRIATKLDLLNNAVLDDLARVIGCRCLSLVGLNGFVRIELPGKFEFG